MSITHEEVVKAAQAEAILDSDVFKEALENLKNANLKHKNPNIYENKKIDLKHNLEEIKSNIKETRLLLKEILENKK